MTYVDYKQLSPMQKFTYKLKKFFTSIPKAIGSFFKTIGLGIAHFVMGIIKGFKNYGTTFVKGDWATKLSYVIFGFGDLHKGKTYKGILYMLVEALYIVFMIVFGADKLYWLPTLGTQERVIGYDEFGFEYVVQEGQRSMLLLLFGTLTLVVTVVVFAIYISNIKDAYKHQLMRERGEKPTTLKQDARDYLDGKYHITLLSFPILMIGIFNIL
ncbi:MAG: sugar ABC transporter permease, partial [Ruminococcus sp.]|nr:sugar ABC transporter permease [Ruminococcus sp.]